MVHRFQSLEELAFPHYHLEQSCRVPFVRLLDWFVKIILVGVCWVVNCRLLCRVNFFFLVFVVHWMVSLAVIVLVNLSALRERKSLLAGEVLKWILDIKATALPDHVEILTRLQNLLLMFCQENWDHFFPVCKSFDPVFVVKINFDVLFQTTLIFAHNKFLKGVFQDSTENPFF